MGLYFFSGFSFAFNYVLCSDNNNVVCDCVLAVLQVSAYGYI